MPKKNDNIVGRAEGPPVAGGHQTPEQAEIVKQEGGGRSDADRSAEAGVRSQLPGNPATGGSSNGHSDQMGSRGAENDRKVAGGLYQTEQDHLEDEKRRHR
jgi:hypothetical protein